MFLMNTVIEGTFFQIKSNSKFRNQEMVREKESTFLNCWSLFDRISDRQKVLTVWLKKFNMQRLEKL